jgi:hypothetical protein
MGHARLLPVRFISYWIVMTLILSASQSVYCQKDHRIKKILHEYGMIQQGTDQGIEKGQRFLVKRQEGETYQTVGMGEIVETLNDRSAIRLVDPDTTAFLRVGDLVFDSEIEFKRYIESFRGILWGISVRDLPNLEYVTTHPGYGGIEIYRMRGEDLRMGSVPVETIEYQFWQSKLSCIRMVVRGYHTFIRLKDVCVQEFGTATQTNSDSDNYTWTGDNTFRQLQYYDMPDQGVLWISSRESIHLQQEYEAREAMLK